MLFDSILAGHRAVHVVQIVVESTVRFDVPASALSLIDAEGRRVVEPGEFRVHIGASSRPQDLLSAGFDVA